MTKKGSGAYRNSLAMGLGQREHNGTPRSLMAPLPQGGIASGQLAT